IILVTFAATTVFWCLVIVGFIWFASPGQADTSNIAQLRRLGFHYLVFDQNRQGRDATFVVESIQTNSAGPGFSRQELLRTNLPPSQTITLGLRKERKE